MKNHEMQYGKELYYNAVNKMSMHDRAVLCTPSEEWRGMAENSSVNIPSKYMLAYISSPDKKKRKALQFYRGKLEMECFNIVDGVRYAENKKMLDLRNTLPEMSLGDFVKYFANADFVITDEYYSLCLAIVLNKPFIYFGKFIFNIFIICLLYLSISSNFFVSNFSNNLLIK